MSADRTLMRNNVENISTRSVDSDELDKQLALLQSAERRLVRMEHGIEKVGEKIIGLRQQLAERRSPA